MKVYKFFYLILSLSFGSLLSAQPLDEVPVHMMLETAEASMAIPDYYTALEWYENAYKETRDPAIAVKIADLQIKLRDFVRAERWLERIVEKDQGVVYPQTVFQYGQVLKVNGNYQGAIDAFNFYAGLNVNDSLLAIADNEVAGIQLAMQSKPPIDLVVENAGRTVNFSETDASPALDREGNLYYSTMHAKEVIVLDGNESDYFMQIFMAKKDEKDGGWDKSKPIDEVINRDGYHTANPSFSHDGTKMFFTRALLTGNALTESKIFMSQEKGEKDWGPPVELQGINGDYIARHPAYGQLYGKEVLFFSANMPGGFGGFDLYYADRISDTEYAIPVNLGAGVNTAFDDQNPFFLNNKLYFSSNGHPGLGGLDVFRVDWNGTAWGKVENLGAGYNSSYDDMYFRVNEEGKLGFLVSNRPDEESRSLKSKTCCDDIYQFHIREVVIDLLASVYEGTTPLVGAKITVFELNQGKTGKSQQQKNDQSHDFQFGLDKDKAYKVLVEKEGYTSAEIPLNTVGINQNQTIKKQIALTKKPDTGMETVTINEAIRLNNIYYDFDDDKILTDAEKDLTFLLGLMKKHPDMVIELSSHTDAQGNDAYNQRLSQRRAQSAKNWLVKNGISEKRIEAVGYGENYILNHCINGIDCTDDEHRFNRRTEFKILEGPTTIEVKRSDLGNQQKKQQGASVITPPNKGTVPLTDPKIELTFTPKNIDLGTVRKGDKVPMSFSFTNTGNQPVQIELVTSCECTTLDWPQGKVFKPGESGMIKAIFDSKDKEVGEITDIEIILTEDDPKTGNPIIYVLKYKFNIVK